MQYWDTSALLKLYATEPDSPYYLDLLEDAAEPLLSSDISRTEMLCALHGKARASGASTEISTELFERFLADIAAGLVVMVPFGSDVFAEARRVVDLVYRQPQPVMLRSLDAMHLASALASQAKGLVATDKRLREAAALCDLPLLPTERP